MTDTSPARPEAAAAADAASQRLTELEIKLCYLEDLVDSLNQQVYEQQQRFELLTRELIRLRDASANPSGPGWTSLRDEIPPHY